MSKTVVGLDLSLTGTGIATVDDDWQRVETVKTPSDKIKGHARLDMIRDTIIGRVMGADLVVVEGPSFGSKGNALHQLGGLWWLVTQTLYWLRTPYVIATPSQVKKYATGKGAGVDKDAVVIAVTKRYPDAGADNNNEADAVVLAAIGKRLLGEPIEDSLPKLNLEAMDKITQEEAA